MAVAKIDPKVIFASEAPVQDTPAVFSNKEVGWGVSRQNGGRPTIKQSNALQQENDLKVLWLNENSVTPFDETIDYPVNAVTIKDGVFKIFTGTVWNLFLTKASVGLNNVDNTSDASKPISTATQTALNLKANQTDVVNLQNTVNLKANTTYVDTNLALKADLSPVKRGTGNLYDPALTYNINETVIKTNGDVVKSSINGNTNNPNSVGTGWVTAYLVPSKNLSDVASATTARTNLDVYSKFETDTNIATAAETPDATETVKGKAELATQVEVNAGTDNEKIVTPLKLKAVAFGIGQTIKDVTASRALGVTYTNPSDKTMLIYVLSTKISNTSLNFKLTVGGFVIQTPVNSTGATAQASITFYPIPPKTTYMVENGDSGGTAVLLRWVEYS